MDNLENSIPVNKFLKILKIFLNLKLENLLNQKNQTVKKK